MYIIKFNEAETKDYRTDPRMRCAFQQAADQQMASRLEPVRIIGADGAALYENRHYKGPTTDLEWHDRQVNG